MNTAQTEIKISARTANLIRLRKMTDDLWNEICNYLDEFEDTQLSNMKKGEFSGMLFERDFEQSLSKIESKLREYQDESITDNLLTKNEVITI
jgi:hypothetical protein